MASQIIFIPAVIPSSHQLKCSKGKMQDARKALYFLLDKTYRCN